MTKLLVFVLGMLLSTSALADDGARIYHVGSKTAISESELFQGLAAVRDGIVVLGEEHYNPAVQRAQARTIEGVVKELGAEKNFTTAWEFLNISADESVQTLWSQWVRGEATGEDFLKGTQGKTDSTSYLPIFAKTQALGGNVMATNLSHKEKAPVVSGGLSALDPNLIPPGFEMGGNAYFERFSEVMAGHTTPEKLQRYYEAQCLTDDVIAHRLLTQDADRLRFLVEGSFHTDYLDGTVARIRARSPQTAMLTVRFIDASHYERPELMGLLHDSRYGDIADYVYFVNFPVTE